MGAVRFGALLILGPHDREEGAVDVAERLRERGPERFSARSQIGTSGIGGFDGRVDGGIDARIDDRRARSGRAPASEEEEEGDEAFHRAGS
ncbi:hypothetical protein BH09MYX1_BH09MYX1_51270 [soil metagenome]